MKRFLVVALVLGIFLSVNVAGWMFYAANSAVVEIDLLGFMVQSSDNIATDMIGRHLGIDAINEGLAAQGFDGFNTLTYLIDVRRAIYRHLAITADDLTPLTVRTIRWTPIWDPQVLRLNTELGLATGALDTDKLLAAYNAFYAQGLNHARVDSVCAIFEAMERGTLVSTKASEEMYALLRGSRTSTARLLGKLPPGTPVAHKTGSQYQRVCDFGIIQLPDRSHLIAGGCATALDPRFSENAIATLARAAYDVANQVRARQKK